jgi:hypothetical protein
MSLILKPKSTLQTYSIIFLQVTGDRNGNTAKLEEAL